MKRETNVKGLPFADNLVFYAPLSKGNLSDRISGVQPTTEDGCTVNWDEQLKAYRLEATYTDRQSALLYGGLNLGKIQDGVTIHLTASIVEDNGNKYSAFCTIPDFKTVGTDTACYICSARYAEITSEPATYTLTMGMIQDGQIHGVFYKNAEFEKEVVWSACYSSEIHTLSVCEINHNCTNLKMYAKDVRVYNRILTPNEIKQL